MAIVILLVLGYGILQQNLLHQDLLHQQHSKQITIFADSGLVIGSSALAKLLRQYFDYEYLDITQLNGQALYHYQESEEDSLVNRALAFIELSPPMVAVELPSHDLIIRYQLKTSSTDDTVLFTAMVVSIGSALALIAIVISAIFRRRRDKAIARAIASHINALNHNQASIPLTQRLGSRYAAIDSALAENQQYLNAQIADAHQAAVEIESSAAKDSLTGLANRHQFINYTNQILSGELIELAPGMLAICRCTLLQHVNQNHGYEQGDLFIKDLAQILCESISKLSDAQCFRLNGADFALLLPRAEVAQAVHIATQIEEKIKAWHQKHNIEKSAAIGFINYQSASPLGELLAGLDTAISLAQTQDEQIWYILPEDDITTNLIGKKNWRETIDNVIEHQRLTLMLQPIEPVNRNANLYSEILARFHTDTDTMLPTAALFTMAEKLDKYAELDKLIVDTVIKLLATLEISTQFFAINLSARSVMQDEFLIWLERRLLRDQTLSTHLVFEVSEYGLQKDLTQSQKFIDMLHRVGARITVEKFGVGMTSFKFFRDFKPDFIKMDGSYSRAINDEKNNQYFLRLMIDLAHRLGVKVIAESVETEKEKATLTGLLIDGNQGYFIAKPALLTRYLEQK